jgi:hypothetical protein
MVLVAAGLVVIAICLFVPAIRSRIFGRTRSRAGSSGAAHMQGRLEVLDSTVIDAERRLLLVRCDRVEHLIMVGGPNGDLVVENDVRKVRQPGAQTKAAVEPAQQPAAASTRPAASPRPAPQPAPRSGTANVVPAPTANEDNAGASRPAARNQEQPRPLTRAGESQPGRRENTLQPRPLQAQPALIGINRPETRRGQGSASGNGRDGEAATARLPAANIPWSEGDSLESEIVQALNVEPRLDRNAAPPTAARDAGTKKQTDSGTTLGDLADRLEEALAREVQSAGKPTAAEPERKPPETRKRLEVKERTETRDRPERAMSAAPEGESRRETSRDQHQERREEAPVISLNARRREAADPIEDEMARLLGELTGDTKSR